MTEPPTDQPDTELTPAELRGWMEFACWTILALAPFLYWVNGPAVSTDQFVVRTALVILAACGTVGFRLFARLHRHQCLGSIGMPSSPAEKGSAENVEHAATGC